MNKVYCEQMNPDFNSVEYEGIIRTYTGIYFNVFAPKEEDICIEDIAHGLSNQCRFGGHTTQFYSVAEHSVHCANLVLEPELKLQALLHDASEAYLVDIPTPIKIMMPEYAEWEAVLMRAIAKKFAFEWPLHKLVERADAAMLEMEWEGIVVSGNRGVMSNEYARSKFLELFDLITT